MRAYASDGGAAMARVDALARENAWLRAQNERLRDHLSGGAPRPFDAGRFDAIMAAAMVLLAMLATAVIDADRTVPAVLPVAASLPFFVPMRGVEAAARDVPVAAQVVEAAPVIVPAVLAEALVTEPVSVAPEPARGRRHHHHHRHHGAHRAHHRHHAR